MNETINKEDLKKILSSIKKEKRGSSLSDIERNTGILRCKVRILIAYLLGADKVNEEIFGMSKVYFIK